MIGVKQWWIDRLIIMGPRCTILGEFNGEEENPASLLSLPALKGGAS